MTRTVRPAQNVVYCHTKMLALTLPAAAAADSYSYADIQLSKCPPCGRSFNTNVNLLQLSPARLHCLSLCVNEFSSLRKI